MANIQKYECNTSNILQANTRRIRGKGRIIFLNRKLNCSKALVLSTVYSDQKLNRFFISIKTTQNFVQGCTVVTIPFCDIFILHICCRYYTNVRIWKQISWNMCNKVQCSTTTTTKNNDVEEETMLQQKKNEPRARNPRNSEAEVRIYCMRKDLKKNESSLKAIGRLSQNYFSSGSEAR